MPVSSASPHSGHRSRLRQRLAREPLAVADYEILELLLGYGQPRKDTKPLARELLLRFHNKQHHAQYIPLATTNRQAVAPSKRSRQRLPHHVMYPHFLRHHFPAGRLKGFYCLFQTAKVFAVRRLVNRRFLRHRVKTDIPGPCDCSCRQPAHD